MYEARPCLCQAMCFEITIHFVLWSVMLIQVFELAADKADSGH